MGRWLKFRRLDFSNFSLQLEETKPWSLIKDKFFYFTRMKKMNKGRPYCVRCSSIIAPDKIEHDLYEWNGFWICKWCYDQKKAGARNGVDLEDLDYMKVDYIKESSYKMKQEISQLGNSLNK